MLKRYSFFHFVYELTRKFVCLIFSISSILISINYSLLFANGFVNDSVFISTFSIFTFLITFILLTTVWILWKILRTNNINNLRSMNKILFLFISYYFYLISSTVAIVVLNYLYTDKIKVEFIFNFIDGTIIISFFNLYFYQKYKVVKSNFQSIKQIKIVKTDENIENVNIKFFKYDVWNKDEQINENIKFNGFYKGKYYFINLSKSESYFLTFDKSYVILSLLNKNELNRYVLDQIKQS